MIAAGMNMARVSLAHGTLQDALARIERIHAAAAAERKLVGVLADLPGPKIRVGAFPEGGVQFTEGGRVGLVAATDGDESNSETIVVNYEPLATELGVGDVVALGDGSIQLQVTDVDVDTGRATADVLAGGWAQGRPGIALPPSRSTLVSPTDDDLRLLEALCEADIDAVAISFVRAAADIERARRAAGTDPPMLVAKIETQEAVADVDDIIAVADGVMVARGDLGIRCPIEEVPHHQKHIIRTGVAYGRPVITATQMLESMVRSPTPTRAEVSDIANAVFDGTSALMLSGETAIGEHPVAAVATMARVALRAEREFDYFGWGSGLGRQQASEHHGAPARTRITAAVSAAAWRAAMDSEAKVIIACTNTGWTPRAISRFRPTVPVLGVTPSPRAARQLTVAWGVTPHLAAQHDSTDDIVWFAVEAAVELGLAAAGDVVAVAVGSPTDREPMTDTLRLVRVR